MNALVDHALLEALALSPDERSLVALSLLDSLEGDGASVDTVTASWVAEVRRRNDDITAGRVQALPLQAFRHWFNAL